MNVIAIEIKNRRTARFIQAIDPSLRGLDYRRSLKGKFFMIAFPFEGSSLVTTKDAITRHWDFVDGGPRLTLKQSVREEYEEDHPPKEG